MSQQLLRHTSKFWVFAATALTSILLLTGTASATTVVRLDLSELVANSTYIGEVSVRNAESFRRDGKIMTRVELSAKDTWTGDAESPLTLELPGGQIGELTTHVHGVPHFEEGDRIVVFLNAANNRSDASFHLTGLSQGVFHIALGPDDQTTYLVPRVGDLNLIEVRQRDSASSDRQLANVSAAQLHRQTHRLETFKQAVLDLIHANQTDGGPDGPSTGENSGARQ